MNSLTIIGNLTRDPVVQTVEAQDGPTTVCRFTVAVSGRRRDDPATFFAVSVWRQQGENCAKYLAKGRKVAVQGAVSGREYQGEDGKQHFQLSIPSADRVEFLSSKGDGESQQPASSPASSAPPPVHDEETGYEQVEMDTDDLPF